MRLSSATLDTLPPAIAQPDYDRDAQRTGIVHLGVGAFHRAHQAMYTDAAMSAGDRDWAITGVSLRSAGVHAQLAPQDGLYTITEKGAEDRRRVIGALREVIVAPEHPAAVVAALADAATHVVTLTITEKGYVRRADGSLDVDSVRATPTSAFHLLSRALAERAKSGAPGLTLLPCDNLAHNGAVLKALVDEWLACEAPSLAGWFARECSCASTMVDRIVPATTADDLAEAERALGVRDEGAVSTEPFHQWVIEERFAGPRPRWEAVGAQLVADVQPYENAKLRMLNGAHSALAYLGLREGYRYVHEAVADARIRVLVEQLMRVEAAGSLSPAPDQDLQRYADRLLGRFANAALPHGLSQIAIDGSQKIGPRWLDPLADHARAGRTCPATLTALAAWIVFVRGSDDRVDDPLSDALADTWQRAGRDGIVDALFGPQGLFAARWVGGVGDRMVIKQAVGRMIGEG